MRTRFVTLLMLCACRGSWVPPEEPSNPEGASVTATDVRENTKTEIEVAMIERVDNYSVQGFVRNWNNMRELPGVTLIVTSPLLARQQTAVADDKGVFVFTGLAPGEYVIKAIHLGTEDSRHAKFKIENGKTTQITVDLDVPI